MDDIEYLNGVLINAGASNLALRLAFLTSVLKEREKVYQREEFPGISQATLRIMIEDYGLQNNIEIADKTTLKVIARESKDFTRDTFRKQIEAM